MHESGQAVKGSWSTSWAKKQGAAAVIDDRRLRFKHVDAEDGLDRLCALGRECLIDMAEIHREQRSRARHDVPEQQLGAPNLKDLKVRAAGTAASCIQGCQGKPGASCHAHVQERTGRAGVDENRDGQPANRSGRLKMANAIPRQGYLPVPRVEEERNQSGHASPFFSRPTSR